MPCLCFKSHYQFRKSAIVMIRNIRAMRYLFHHPFVNFERLTLHDEDKIMCAFWVCE